MTRKQWTCWAWAARRAGRPKLGKGWVLWLGLWLSLTSARALDFYINNSAELDPAVLRAYDLVIIHPEAEVGLAKLKRPGFQAYAYVSVVELAEDAPYRRAALGKSVPLAGRNELWRSDLVDVRNSAWESFVVQNLAKAAVDKDFDGFFLDTVESVELLAQREPAQATAYRAALVRMVKALKAAYPDKPILLNRGFKVWEEVRTEIAGVLIESVFQTFDPATKQYRAVEAAGTQWLLEAAQRIQAAKLAVYIVDYVDPRNLELATATAQRIEANGFNALVTTPELEGEVLAPLREQPRRLLALYGSQEVNLAQAIRWPADSVVGQYAQTPLEWLGYEVDYLNLNQRELPETLSSKYAGIILDRYLQVIPPRESKLVDWLIAQKRQGRKLLFFGNLVVEQPEVRRQLLHELGLTGSGQPVAGVSQLSAPIMAAAMNFEAKVPLLPTRFFDLRAPPEATRLLSVQARTPDGHLRSFDAVFTAPWGGMALDPYLFFRRPDYDEHWLVDPFHFFGTALAQPAFPAPDPTTRDGVRLFFSHIDGDGLRHRSSVRRGAYSGEVVATEVLRKYPLPFTCSIIEAELRAWVTDQPASDAEPLTELARTIFALPNVEIACHTYSHPFYWADDDKTAQLYDAPHLNLKPEYQLKQVDLKREVIDASEFIKQRLVPPGKRLEAFLWSGNCRPPPEAIRMARELGLENINGGDTIISRQHPSLTKVAPRTMPWGDEVQVYAAIQNENVFRQRWEGNARAATPFWGGFMHARETFEMTEKPRRLKPVNLYFHWYSGDNLPSLKALTGLYDWALTQELHAVPATEYTRAARDSRASRVFRRGERRWVVCNEGHCRTWRLPKSAGWPDLEASRGVLGYRSQGDALYVHTDGSPRVELALRDQPGAGVFLVGSTAPIQVRRLTRTSAEFSVQDFRPATVTWGGFPPGATVSLRANQAATSQKADSLGEVKLLLPSEAQVTVNCP